MFYFAHATIFGRKLSFAIFKQGLKNTTFGIEINTKKNGLSRLFRKFTANCTLLQNCLLLMPKQQYLTATTQQPNNTPCSYYHFSGIPANVSTTIIAAVALATRISLSRSRTSILMVTNLSSACVIREVALIVVPTVRL